MIRTIIYINGEVVDISPGTVVASTFKALEIGDIKTRNANYTNRFKLPKTTTNLRILEHADLIKSDTGKPYTKLPAKLVQNGLEIIPSGVAYIVDCEDGFNVNIYSGLISFFDAVADYKLHDLDFSSNDYGSLNNIVEVPYVDDGDLDQTLNPLPFSSVGYSVPYKNIIEKIIATAGYTQVGSIFSDPKLAAMYLTALGWDGYNQRFTEPKEFEAFRDTSVVFNATGVAQKVNFTDVRKDANGWYDGVNTYTVQDPQGGLFGGTYFVFDVFATITISVVLSGAPGIDIRLFSNSGDYLLSGVGSGTYELELSPRTSGSVSGIEATEVYMTIRTTLGIGTATVTFSVGRIFNKVSKVIQPTYVSILGILPDYKQRDLFRDFLVRFGVMLRETNRILEAKTIESILADRANAVDWTNKRDVAFQEKVAYDFRGYSQNNLIKYSVGDDLVNEETGQGNLPVGNENLSVTRDFYTSDFNSSITERLGNTSAGFVTTSRIPIEPDQSDPGLRLLLIRGKYSYEPTLAGGVSSYNVGYFEDSLAPYSLTWQSFMEEYYPTLIKSLDRPKVVTRYYQLTEFDIATLDLFKLVFDNGDYFLINVVENFIPGRSTKVELFKVS